MMQIQVTAEGAYARKVQITVPAVDVRAALEKAYRDVVQRARLPGFRKGKVPRQVVEARFGASIANDVAGDLIQRGWTATLAEHALEVVSRPSVLDQGEVRAGVDFTFTIGVDVRPVVDVSVIDGVEVYWPKAEVDPDEVEVALEQRRQGQSRLTAVSDRPVRAGDTVQVEVKAVDGDEVVVDEPGTLVRTEGEQWLKGLGSLLVGLEVDGTAQADVTFADDARNADVAGRTLATTVKVLSIQAYEAPALDDALAEELGHADVAALRAAVAAELAQGREEAARNQARANLLEKLIAVNPFDVPDGMVRQNLAMLVEELKLQRAYQGIDPKDLRFTEAQMADLRHRAVFAAKGALILESVSKKQGLEVTDADLDAKLAELAEGRGQTVEAVRGWFERDGALDDLRERLLEERTLDWLLERAAVTHEPPEELEGEDQPSTDPDDLEGDDAALAGPAEVIAEEAPAKKAPAKKAPAKKAAAKKAAPEPEPAPEPEAAPEPAPKKGGSKYKTIGGVKYARDLLDLADEAGKSVGVKEIKAIVAAAGDGKGVTDTEKRTLAWIRDNAPLTDAAKKWLVENADLD